jgi:hypothetical protein
MATKYKLTISELERAGNIRKLEKDGFNRDTIHRAMYKATDGATTEQRREIIQKLYKRGDC